MLTAFQLDRLIRMANEYIDIMEYAVSKYALWVDIYCCPNDIYEVKIIRDILIKLLDNKIGGGKQIVNCSYRFFSCCNYCNKIM